MNIDEAQLDMIADALIGCGYLIADNLLPEYLITALLADFNALLEGEFTSAGIGRNADFAVQKNIRSDRIHWLDSTTPTSAEFLLWMELLRVGINRRLFLGLCDYESHFSHYPIAAFYKKHLDAFSGQQRLGRFNRALSTVVYLNKNWHADQGGELIIYADSGDQVLATVQPVFGRLVIFLSEKFSHEVMPATRERKGIAGWFRANNG